MFRFGFIKKSLIIEVKNLNQFFTEFKNYRETKKNVVSKENFYEYVDNTYSVTEYGIGEATVSKKSVHFSLKLKNGES